MTLDDQTLEAYVRSMAKILELELSDASVASVMGHLRIGLKMSSEFMEFPIADEVDPAPVFAP